MTRTCVKCKAQVTTYYLLRRKGAEVAVCPKCYKPKKGGK